MSKLNNKSPEYKKWRLKIFKAFKEQLVRARDNELCTDLRNLTQKSVVASILYFRRFVKAFIGIGWSDYFSCREKFFQTKEVCLMSKLNNKSPKYKKRRLKIFKAFREKVSAHYNELCTDLRHMVRKSVMGSMLYFRRFVKAFMVTLWGKFSAGRVSRGKVLQTKEVYING